MSLTVGTTLQNGNFVIEATLHQSDFGVTYQAAHPGLNHPVVLQSFNEVLRQRSDFGSLRQKFLQEVLVFSKQPSDTAAVIDCFEENGMPFVVLEATIDQSIPHLSDWLEIPIEALLQEASQPAVEASASAVEAAVSEATPEVTAVATVVAAPIAPAPVVTAPITPAPITTGKTAEITPVAAEELASASAEPFTGPSSRLESFPLPNYATNGSSKGVKVLVSQSPKPRKWMPLALLMTALITGFGGVGLGLALRFKPTPTAANSTSDLSSGWFEREQSFPPQQDWPIIETPNLYPPSAAIEQPLYQPSPLSGAATPRVQPPTDYIPPAQITAPAYQPPSPSIADYPPLSPDPIPSVEPDVPAAPAAPEATQPVIPLPAPITPPEPLEAAPEPPKTPSSSKNVPTGAPIIFRQ